VALANVGEQFAGRYTLTSTRHLFSEQAGYTTEFAASGRQERSLYGLVTGAAGGRRPVEGLVPAIVSDVRDPLGLGRVRLTFPWLAKDFASGWARTVQIGGGKGRGALVLPEVGDEVLVGFAGGNLDEPYVLGGLHNGQDTTPTTSVDPIDRASGEIAARAFVSRTGHRIELVENDGIVIATGDGRLSVRLDKKKGVVEVRGGNGVTIDAGTGPLELKGQKVFITAMSEAELTANAQVTVRGGVIRLN
jgi:phage baseplate assembly protein gpV